MGGLGLTAVQRELIVVELAAHLEDLYEERRTQGLSEPEAIERTLDEVGDWCVLALQIRSFVSLDCPACFDLCYCPHTHDHVCPA